MLSLYQLFAKDSNLIYNLEEAYSNLLYYTQSFVQAAEKLLVSLGALEKPAAPKSFKETEGKYLSVIILMVLKV